MLIQFNAKFHHLSQLRSSVRKQLSDQRFSQMRSQPNSVVQPLEGGVQTAQFLQLDHQMGKCGFFARVAFKQ